MAICIGDIPRDFFLNLCFLKMHKLKKNIERLLILKTMMFTTWMFLYFLVINKRKAVIRFENYFFCAVQKSRVQYSALFCTKKSNRLFFTKNVAYNVTIRLCCVPAQVSAQSFDYGSNTNIFANISRAAPVCCYSTIQLSLFIYSKNIFLAYTQFK